MRRGTKIFTTLAAMMAVMLLGSGLLLAGTVAVNGLVTVQVDESGPDGTDVYIPVPAGLLYAGLALVPMFAGDELDEMRQEIGEWGPFLTAAAEAFEDCPDAVLVDVQDGDETVRIVKRGRALDVFVDGHDGKVHITVPAALFRHVVKAVA
jgi:hypothetical protein